MKLLSKRAQFDIGLVSQALNNTNATGRYFGMQMDRKALFILNGGAMAATKTTKIELLQAKDAAGTDAKAIANASATITANTLVTELTLTLATVVAADTVTINGIVFTAHADTTTKANREFSISGLDAADAAELASCINDATYGVPGVTAEVADAVITLKVTDPGAKTITAATSGATVTIATTQAQAYVEVDVSSLDHANDFEYVAAKVTTTANSNVAVVLVRGDSRFEPVQVVGASAAV